MIHLEHRDWMEACVPSPKDARNKTWPEISDMKTARARISRPIWPRNIQRVCMTSIRQNEIEGVVAHLEHLPRSL